MEHDFFLYHFLSFSFDLFGFFNILAKVILSPFTSLFDFIFKKSAFLREKGVVVKFMHNELKVLLPAFGCFFSAFFVRRSIRFRS